MGELITEALYVKKERERVIVRLWTGSSSCVVRNKRCVRDRVLLLGFLSLPAGGPPSHPGS